MIRNIWQRFNTPIPGSLADMSETINSERWNGKWISLLDGPIDDLFFQGSLEYLNGKETMFGGLILIETSRMYSNII